MSQKQNDIFKMATNHKLSSQFRNESLGLWYDAKSCVAKGIAELKSQVVDLKLQFDQESFSSPIKSFISSPHRN